MPMSDLIGPVDRRSTAGHRDLFRGRGAADQGHRRGPAADASDASRSRQRARQLPSGRGAARARRRHRASVAASHRRPGHIIHIEDRGRSTVWTAEGRMIHQTSHSTRGRSAEPEQASENRTGGAMQRRFKISVDGRDYDVVVEEVIEGRGSGLYPEPQLVHARGAAEASRPWPHRRATKPRNMRRRRAGRRGQPSRRRRGLDRRRGRRDGGGRDTRSSPWKR